MGLFDVINYFVEVCIVLLSVVGNSLVLVSVKKFEWLKSPTNYFVSLLAFFDFVNGMPTFVGSKITSSLLGTNGTISGSFEVGCKTSVGIALFSGYGDLLSIALITVDQFLYINRPLRYRDTMTAKKALISCTVVLILTSVVSVVGVLVSRVAVPCNTISVLNRSILLYYMSPNFIVVLLMVIWLYSKIAVLAFQARKNATGESHNQGGSQNKATKVMSLVIGVFFFSYVTYFSAFLVILYAELSAQQIFVLQSVFIWTWQVSSTFLFNTCESNCSENSVFRKIEWPLLFASSTRNWETARTTGNCKTLHETTR